MTTEELIYLLRHSDGRVQFLMETAADHLEAMLKKLKELGENV